MEFNNNNSFTTTKGDFTNTFQKEPRKSINENQFITREYTKWKYFYHNRTPPKVRGLIENHEISTTIRPIVNWINVPAYELPTLIVCNLETHIPLPSASNVKITIQLIDDLLAFPHNKDRNLSLLILPTHIRRFPPKNCSKSSN